MEAKPGEMPAWREAGRQGLKAARQQAVIEAGERVLGVIVIGNNFSTVLVSVLLSSSL